MKNNQNKKDSLSSSNSNHRPVFYEIQVQGQLDPQRSKWFEGMTLTYVENRESRLACTIISGLVIDQPALHGLLAKIRDLNLTLISVRRSIPGISTGEEISNVP
jgi:hypothetical protein